MIDRYFQSNYFVLTNALNSGNIPAMKSAHFFNMLNTKYYILDLNSSGVVGNMNPQKPDEKPGVLPKTRQFRLRWRLNQDVNRLETKSCTKIMHAKVTNLGQKTRVVLAWIAINYIEILALRFFRVPKFPKQIHGSACPIG